MQRLSRIVMTIDLFGGVAIAGPFDHPLRAELALKQARYWHVTEWLPGGGTFNMNYPTPNITEVIVGSNDYMLTAGQVMRLPPTYAAMMARTVHIHLFDTADRAVVGSTQR